MTPEPEESRPPRRDFHKDGGSRPFHSREGGHSFEKRRDGKNF
ncbi:polyribonucleotide nucleotidyltransferase [Thermoanaerobacterium thermosaccharolyticum]|nr:polyribonucleotide nucleotidyltransferase [Thermoanaerobacterium thermosaccharolyticum]